MIGRVVTARGMAEKGFIENGRNAEKYPNLTEKRSFQGAYVGTANCTECDGDGCTNCSKTGRMHGKFRYVLHTDVA